MLPADTRLVYAADYGGSLVFGGATPSQLIEAIRQPLEDNWNVFIEKSDGSASLAGESSITLWLRLGSAYGQADDVRKNVDHEIYQTGVQKITGSRITSVKLPGQGSQDTGAPPPDGTASGSIPGCGFLATQLGLCSGFQWTTVAGLAFVAMFAMVLILIFVSPATPARVAASFAHRR